MFKITTKMDYGMIILRSLADHYGKGPKSLMTIADENTLPYRYLTQIARPLQRTGIITSTEGVSGGYELSRSPSLISLREIALSLEPQKKLNRCLSSDHTGCQLKPSCQMAPWWFQFNIKFQNMIKEITLDDFI